MKNKRRLLTMAAVILIGIGVSMFVFWQTQGPRIVAAIHEAILVRASQSLNGRLAADDMVFSMLGATTAQNVVIFDKQNKVVASCEKMIFDFSIADLLRGNFALEKIKRVTVEGAHLALNHDAKGNWNVETLLKPIPEEDVFRFRGEVKLNGGSASVSGPEGTNQLLQIEGSMDFASYPEIRTELTGIVGDSRVAVEGSVSASGAANLKLQTDRVEPSLILAFLPSADKTLFQGGQVHDLSATLRRDKGPVEIDAKGVLSGMSADFSGVKFAAMQGNLKFAQNILDIQDASLQYAGQKLAVQGKINFTASKPGFDLVVKGDFVDLAALSGNSPVLGVTTVQSVVKGPADALEISGNFSIPSGTFSSLAFSDAGGAFSYANNTLTLREVSLNSLGGKLTLSGTWNQKTFLFEQNITGKNIDAAFLSHKAIQGSLDFSSRVTGGKSTDTKMQGNFSMPTTVINGNTLEKISGNFSKIGQSLEVAGLNFSVAGQKVTTSGKILLSGDDPELDLQVRSDGIEIAAVKPDAPIRGPLAFQAVIAGTVKNHDISGSIQMPAGQFGTLPVVDVDGKFQFSADALKIQELQFSLVGDSNTKHTMTATGNIAFEGKETKLDLTLRSDSIEIAEIKKGLPVSGQLAFQTLISGTAKDPAATGTFQIPSGKISAFPFTDGSGEFRFSSGVLNLQAVRFDILGGSVTSEGTIAKSGAYRQQIIGHNLDAALLTEGDIRGRANLTANIFGEGEKAKASTDGKVVMASGTIKNTGFSSLNLDFRTQGERVEIPSLNIKFFRGLVKGTGYTEGDYLVVKLTPATDTSSRLARIGTFLLFGSNPLAAIIGQTLAELFPLGIIKIRINGLKAQGG